MLPNVPQYPVAVAGDPARRAAWWSTSTRSTRRASSSTSSRTRAPRRSSSSRTSPRRCSRCIARGADQARRARGDGRHARLPQGRDRQLRRAQGEEDGAGVRACPARCASTTRSRRARGKPSSRPRGRARRHRRAAVHRRHHRRVSKGAVLLHRNLVANILQSEAWYQPALKKIPAGEQVVTHLRAAALSHLRLQHEHDAVDAHGRRATS